MSKADEFVQVVKDMFSDGRTKQCRDARGKYNELIGGATDEELQEMANKGLVDLESLKNLRARYQKSLDK